MPWDIKRFSIFLGTIILLYGSWLAPGTREIWRALDLHVFLFLNSWISTSPFWQHFWAYANHNLNDWLFDLVMLIFFSLYVVKAPAGYRRKCTVEVIYTIVYCSLTIILINRYFFTKFLNVKRPCPTLVVEGATKLSEILTDIKIKDTSTRSFPGDHATTSLLFVLTIYLKMGARYGLYALGVTSFFILPRMIVGAHWFSDVAVGSLSIALFAVAIGHISPLKRIILRWRSHETVQRAD